MLQRNANPHEDMKKSADRDRIACEAAGVGGYDSHGCFRANECAYTAHLLLRYADCSLQRNIQATSPHAADRDPERRVLQP